jgi:hypothetical protein
MKTELKEICRDLRWLADNTPPGAERNQMQADLTRLHVKLDALPGLVAAKAAMKSADEVKVVLDDAFADAFRDVMKWLDAPLPVEIVATMTAAGFTPTLQNLQEMIAKARADAEQVEWRRQPHALLGLIPEHIDEETARKAAVAGTLIAKKVGNTRWFTCIEAMEDWMRRTDRWFETKKAEESMFFKMQAAL